MYGFELGREFKLSVAEIYAFFKNARIEYLGEKILILDDIKEADVIDFSLRCGGIIKIFYIEKTLKSDSFGTLIQLCSDWLIGGKKESGKLLYGVNIFGKGNIVLKNFLPKLKLIFKEQNISSRFLNQNFQNLSSAIILGEKIVSSQTDINIVFGSGKTYFGPSVWVQDINAYSKRDFGKKRDMEIGMLPPKLSQIMIHLGIGNKKKFRLYDPFCGLGTVLIESVLMGNEEVYGSDINPAMIEASMENINFLEENFEVPPVKSAIVLQDARKIQESRILKDVKIDTIVTEGYLGELFTFRDVSFDKVSEERKKLALLYKDFFAGLSKMRFQGTVVICFPFWDIGGKYIYFFEIYDILKRYCDIEKLVPNGLSFKESMSGSLFYKRNNQVVGREIFKLKMKY